MTAERNCICPRWMSARECARSRDERPYGFGDSPDSLADIDDECECGCHEEQRTLDQEQDDMERQRDMDDDDGYW